MPEEKVALEEVDGQEMDMGVEPTMEEILEAGTALSGEGD